MELFECRPEETDRAWRDGAHALSEACKWASREVTPDQLKMLFSRGERVLIGARENGQIKGWAAVGVQQLPNIRVLHVYSMAGSGIINRATYALLSQYAAAHGCSSVRMACRPSMVRLMQRLGAKPLYQTLEMEVA